MINQLRVYEIFEHNKAAYHNRFRDHAMRIMKTYGFDFVDVWESTSQDRVECLYLLRWPDPETMESAWAAFSADQEWLDIKASSKAEHGALVGQIEEYVLTPTDYSP